MPNIDAGTRTYQRYPEGTVGTGSVTDAKAFPEVGFDYWWSTVPKNVPSWKNRDDASRAELDKLKQQYLPTVREVRPAGFVIENGTELRKSDHFSIGGSLGGSR